MRGILEVGLRTIQSAPALLAACAMQAYAACAPAPPLVLERFVPADCEPCWAARPPNPERGRAALAIDWIVPSARASALAPRAIPEAAARAERAGGLASDEALTLSHPLRARGALCVEASGGVAVNGYIGLRFAASYSGKRPLPGNTSGWIALVERIPAGEEGSQVERHLVRALVGPIALGALADERVSHLSAVRVPETGRAERWISIGWVETDKGRILAVGLDQDRRE